MKTLVTGADGLLGGNLVRLLLERNYQVRALVQPRSRSTSLDGLDIEKRPGDILDIKGLKEAVRDCEAVFHCAASTALYPPRDPMITRVNVEGTRNVLDAAQAAGVKRMVHVGSASSFGFGTKETPGDENTPFKYEKFGLAYFDSKLQAQSMVLDRVKTHGIDAVVVNPTFMLGSWDFGPSSGRLIQRFVQMKPPVYPPGGRNFVHVHDAAAGMIAALEKGRKGECYILGCRNLDMGEFFTMVAKSAGIKPPRYLIPEPVMLAAGRIGTSWAKVSGTRPEFTYEIALSSCTGSYYSPLKAVRELFLPQTPVELAVEDSYRWLKDKGYL